MFFNHSIVDGLPELADLSKSSLVIDRSIHSSLFHPYLECHISILIITQYTFSVFKSFL